LCALCRTGQRKSSHSSKDIIVEAPFFATAEVAQRVVNYGHIENKPWIDDPLGRF